MPMPQTIIVAPVRLCPNQETPFVRVNFDQPIPMPKGMDSETITYKQVVVNNLRQWGRPPGTDTRDGKLRRARLAERIDAGGETTLTPEEKNDLLDMGEAVLTPFMFARLYDLMDAARPAEQS